MEICNSLFAGIEQWVLEHSDPDWAPPPDEAVVLTEANFTKFINKYDLSLVEFYAPWCVADELQCI